MVQVTISLAEAGQVAPMPFVNDGGKAVAWVEIGGPGRAGVFGTPAEMRDLAAAATAAADQAEEMLRVAELLVDPGMAERPAA